MNERVSPQIAMLISTVSVFGIGLWLGRNWYGDDEIRKCSLEVAAIVIAALGSLFWLKAHRLNWLKFAGGLALSLLAFEVGIYIGNNLYLGPDTATDFVRLLVAAASRQL